MAQVKIVVTNKSKTTQTFQIFAKAPTLTAKPSTGYSNVWAQVPSVAAETGSATFNITESYFAVCGMALQPIEKGLVVPTYDYQ